MAEEKKRKKRKIGVNKDGTISKVWQKFFDKLGSVDSVPVCEWDTTHLLGYICKRFKLYYGVVFSFPLRGAPTKCSELFFVKQMSVTLGTTNPVIIKEYIDWVFDNKIIKRNSKISSVAYFSSASMCNEFKVERAQKHKITRSTPLPEEFVGIADTLGVSAATYGDVAFIQMAIDQNPEAESRRPYREFLRHIKSFGFDESVLEGLK